MRESFNFLAVLPFSLDYLSFRVCVGSMSMLFSVGPLSSILAAIWPADLSVTVLLVEAVFSLIDFASLQWPLEDTLAMHHVVTPFAFVTSSIWPNILSKANYVIVSKLAFIL